MKVTTERYRETETTIDLCEYGNVVFWKTYGYCLVVGSPDGRRAVAILRTGHLIFPDHNYCVKPVDAVCHITISKDELD